MHCNLYVEIPSCALHKYTEKSIRLLAHLHCSFFAVRADMLCSILVTVWVLRATLLHTTATLLPAGIAQSVEFRGNGRRARKSRAENRLFVHSRSWFEMIHEIQSLVWKHNAATPWPGVWSIKETSNPCLSIINDKAWIRCLSAFEEIYMGQRLF